MLKHTLGIRLIQLARPSAPSAQTLRRLESSARTVGAVLDVWRAGISLRPWLGLDLDVARHSERPGLRLVLDRLGHAIAAIASGVM